MTQRKTNSLRSLRSSEVDPTQHRTVNSCLNQEAGTRRAVCPRASVRSQRSRQSTTMVRLSITTRISLKVHPSSLRLESNTSITRVNNTSGRRQVIRWQLLSCKKSQGSVMRSNSHLLVSSRSAKGRARPQISANAG